MGDGRGLSAGGGIGDSRAWAAGWGVESKTGHYGGASTDLGSKPAIKRGVSTDSEGQKGGTPGRAPSASACEPFRELIEEAPGRGRNAMAIYQDLVDDHGFGAKYASVKRFVVKLRGTSLKEARVVIVTAPGEDYGETRVMSSGSPGSF